MNVDTPIELVESMTSIQTTEMMLQNTTTTTSNSQMMLFSHNIKYEYVHPTLVLLSRQRERGILLFQIVWESHILVA